MVKREYVKIGKPVFVYLSVLTLHDVIANQSFRNFFSTLFYTMSINLKKLDMGFFSCPNDNIN